MPHFFLCITLIHARVRFYPKFTLTLTPLHSLLQGFHVHFISREKIMEFIKHKAAFIYRSAKDLDTACVVETTRATCQGNKGVKEKESFVFYGGSLG